MFNNKAKQSIYGFRGACPASVSNFIAHYGARELFLTKNFRSHDTIVSLANNSIKRKEEQMVSHTEEQGSVTYYEFHTEQKELAWLVKCLQTLKGS